MVDNKEFDSPQFKVDDYVKNLVRDCVGGPELTQRKSKIQGLSDQTSSALKKHVYENYMQFIETAKEISHLESEMYQLSHLLIEQRNLLNVLKEDSLPENQRHEIEKNENEDEDEVDEDKEVSSEKKVLSLIKESLIGYTGNLENKTFIHDGSLTELDSNDYHPICLTHLFLFTDMLIIAKVRHAPKREIEFLKQYDVKKIAMTNIKHGVRCGINVITPDGTRIFQGKNITAKNEWLEKFDSAIKYNPIKAPSKKGPAPLPPPLQKQTSMVETKSISSDMTLSPTDGNFTIENMAPDWLLSSSEEIQALIAQRHFEDALSVIQKCDEYMAKDKTFHNYSEIFEKMKGLKSNLSNVLLLELTAVQSRSLQAALRSSRRALKVLADMGKAREACGTLLRVCTTAIRTGQRQARRNNLAISDLFFCDLAQVASEFLRAFNSQPACTSALIVWCNIELQYFASQLIKHYLTKGTQLEVVAKCIEGVRTPCSDLTKIGIDLSYHMEGLLRNSVEQLIEESRLRLIETTGRTEEIWQPYNLQTKSNLRSLLRDFDNLGIDMKPQVTGDTWINLTQSTVNFCRHFLTVTEQCGILAKYESLKNSCEVLLRDLFISQQNIKPNSNINIDLNFVAKNKTYLNEVLLPIAIKKFDQQSGSSCEILSELQGQLKAAPKPKPRSVYKTDVL